MKMFPIHAPVEVLPREVFQRDADILSRELTVWEHMIVQENTCTQRTLYLFNDAIKDGLKLPAATHTIAQLNVHFKLFARVEMANSHGVVVVSLARDDCGVALYLNFVSDIQCVFHGLRVVDFLSKVND